MKTIKTSKTRRKFEIQFGKIALFLSMFFFLFSPQFALAHCDSYDGPVIKDALRALSDNNVELVLKWVEKEHEPEIKSLFVETQLLKNSNKAASEIIEKHFLETLVRLHREGEGAPFTGLKPVGSTTEIIQMADNSLAKQEVNSLLRGLVVHLESVIKEKYQKAAALSITKEESVEQGRAYVEAYVDYTHTLEALEEVLSHGAAH